MSDELPRKIWDVIIVGAGIAGLSARRILRSTDLTVLTIEKSRGLGGRVSTKRANDAVVDLGAQFFSAQTAPFKSFIDELSPSLFHKVTLPDSPRYPRYCLVDGMSRLAKAFVESPIQENFPIVNSVKILSIRYSTDDSSWQIICDGGLSFQARLVLVTAPLPQGLDLIEDIESLLATHQLRHLRDLKFEKCIAGIFHLDSDLSVATDGIYRYPRSELTGIYSQGGKGIRTKTPVLAVHAAPDFSESHWESDETRVIQTLLRLALESLNA